MAAVVSNNSEELILELFDVLERCPPRARDAATDAALETIAAAGAPEEPEQLVKKEACSFTRPPSAYDRYRDALKAQVTREHPDLEPLAINEQLRLNWADLSEAEKAPYVSVAKRERDAYMEAQEAEPDPWDSDRPKRPPTVFDEWVRATKPRETIGVLRDEKSVRKRITELYKAVSVEEKAPYQQKFEAAKAAFLVEEKAWAEKWDLVKTCKGYVSRSHPSAINQAKRLAPKTEEATTRSHGVDSGRPSKPPNAYTRWRRDHVDEVRKEHPKLDHRKLEKKLNALYAALDEAVRAPYDKSWEADKEKWRIACERWDAEQEVKEDAPPNPTAYPKAPDIWSRDLKETYRAKFPSLSPLDVNKKMKSDWSAMSDDDPVKSDYKKRSMKLKEEYAQRFAQWTARNLEEGPRKKRRAANAEFDPHGADASGLSRAAHLTEAQKELLEAKRGLFERDPTHPDALDAGTPAHEALSRRFAADIGVGESTELLKHYYSKIANWLKRQPL